MLSYSNCQLCPRRCGVDRTQGQLGFCQMPAGLIVARAAPHLWEEPVISGHYGTGAVFFSGCTLRCGFCQNAVISQDNYGQPISTARLRAIFEALLEQGTQSISLITPTHFLPSILPALRPKLPVPVVYNCGGYESVETLRQLDGLIDVYLPDFKYSDNRLAARLSKAGDYAETAAAAISEMYRQTGPAVIRDGLLQQGVLVRHLILPGQIENSLGVLDWFSEAFPKKDALLSLMSQYLPMGPLAETAPFDRPITSLEYDAVRSYLDLLGITQGFLQDASSAASQYVPDFHLQGILAPPSV